MLREGIGESRIDCDGPVPVSVDVLNRLFEKFHGVFDRNREDRVKARGQPVRADAGKAEGRVLA